jgi:hypothetical protein
VGERHQITNKLRLRCAARSSGEHRRMTLRSLEACRVVSKNAASTGFRARRRRNFRTLPGIVAGGIAPGYVRDISWGIGWLRCGFEETCLGLAACILSRLAAESADLPRRSPRLSHSQRGHGGTVP